MVEKKDGTLFAGMRYGEDSQAHRHFTVRPLADSVVEYLNRILSCSTGAVNTQMAEIAEFFGVPTCAVSQGVKAVWKGSRARCWNVGPAPRFPGRRDLLT